MPFAKSALKKTFGIVDGETVEVIDLSFKYEILPGESYENIRTAFLQRCDKRFTEMFAAELGLMPARMEEGERWHQLGMFDDPIMDAANAFRQAVDNIGADSVEFHLPDDDDA